jgi:hypothetical protein
VVIVLVVRTFLIPFSFVVGAANLLSKIGIAHVDKTKEKAPEMGEVSDAASCSLHGRIKFKEAIDNH